MDIKYDYKKPGMKKGPPENLRPIILLSILRTLLANCVIRKIDSRVRYKIIPDAFKLLAEKALTNTNYQMNFLKLDTSKAFDTIQRGYLFNDLKEILEEDELHLIHLLLGNVSDFVSSKTETKFKRSVST